MPFVEIKLWEGRTREQKADVARRITDVLVESAGCTPESVTIVFEDFARADWAERGRLCDDLGLRGAGSDA